MRLLITGAAGFTGIHFISSAIKSGHIVHALKSDLMNCHDIKNEVAEFLPEVIVHLGAISSILHNDVIDFYKVNVLGTTNLLEALIPLSSSIKKVLIASSANIYGNKKNSPISEEDIPSPTNHYSCSKLSMEYISLTYAAKLPIFIVRPLNYTGAGQTESFVIAKIISHFKSKSKFISLGNTKISREFNDVRFVCDVYLKLLEKAKVGEIYNICTGKYYTLDFVISILTDLTGHSLKVESDSKLFRDNEIIELYGNPKKIESCIRDIKSFELIDTLNWMLKGQQ